MFFQTLLGILNWLKMSNVVSNFPSKFYGALASALLDHIIMAELFVTQSPTFKSEDVIPLLSVSIQIKCRMCFINFNL